MTDPRIERGMAAQLASLAAVVGPGEPPLGWKLGFGSASSMDMLGTSAPLVGYLANAARVESGTTVSITGWSNAIAEPEIAVHLAADISRESGRDAVALAIDALGPAIELVDVDPPPEDVEAILACNLYQRGVVLGPMDSTRRGGITDGLRGRVHIGDLRLETDDVTAMTGDPVELVCHVADVLESVGIGLRQGHIVITGSIVPPVPVRPGDRVRFDLEPVGGVEVRFVGS